MKPNRKQVALISCLIALSLVVAHGSGRQAQIKQSRSVALPSFAILDEQAVPLIASSGKVGFVSSVTSGSLIAFSATSGKILSSIVVGQTAGPISMIEKVGRRLIAVASANDPGNGQPATVSIIDATSAKRLDLISILALPADAFITTATRALLTGDGRFCLIASSFDEPSLFSFNVETGEITSRLPLAGRASEMAFYESAKSGKLAIASAEANSLSIIELDEQGQLSSAASFSPDDARFEQSNNPAFGADGQTLYIAASIGERLFAIDAANGALLGSVSIAGVPQRVTVATSQDEGEIIGVTRTQRPSDGKPGGVTVLTNSSGRLALKAEFTPPDSVEFSRANNVVFSEDASVAFVGSATGILFAFGADTGELESFQVIGSELRRIALSESGKKVAAVRSSASGDEVVVIEFDLVASDEPEPAAPQISSLAPDTVEQGRAKNLALTVQGENFSEGASLIVNGEEIAGELVRKGTGKALAAKLPRSLFAGPGEIKIQVKGIDGALSQPVALRVLRPLDPVITGISPAEVPGPSSAFTLKVTGKNFRASSTISIGGQLFSTQQVGNNQLQALVPSDLTRSFGQLGVQVKDLAVDGLVSNEKSLLVYGPRIREIKASTGTIVAGGSDFELRVRGENFRSGADVEINGKAIPARRARRLSSKLIAVNVPGDFIQEAGRLAVIVRNPEGVASEAKQINARAPEIKAFAPGKLLAGTSDVSVELRGANFRKRARVYVGDGSGRAFKVERRRVRFHSRSRMVVTLSGELNQLLAQPGTLKFQIVNPNDGDGVPSIDRAVKVAGPEISEVTIEPANGDGSQLSLMIAGANFRRGAVVEFVKSGVVVRQQVPVGIRDNRLVIGLRARKLDALGSFKVRVVNPGNVSSNAVEPRLAESAQSNQE